MPVLHFSRNPNPRLAVAVARHLDAPVTLAFARPFHPEESARILQMNPNQRLPILEEDDGTTLWEADAIACRLSQMVGADFWRAGKGQPDMIRWISWGKEHFVMACDMVHFELGTKWRYDLGPTDPAKIDEGMRLFHTSAALLNGHLAGRDWLTGDGMTGDAPSYADFRMATFLPFDDVMHLPLADYPALKAWNDRLRALPAWADPFAGLDAPPLPPA